MILQAEIYENKSTTYTKSLYQHDKNVTLVFEGIDLPEQYEVHFSNDKDGRNISVACKGTAAGVKIPDELLSTGYYVYAWVCDTDEVNGKGAIFTVVIPVIPRPVPIPVHVEVNCDHDPSDFFDYSVDPDEENLTFYGLMNNSIDPNKEEEN